MDLALPQRSRAQCALHWVKYLHTKTGKDENAGRRVRSERYQLFLVGFQADQQSNVKAGGLDGKKRTKVGSGIRSYSFLSRKM